MRFSCAASILFALSGSSFVAKATATELPSSMPTEQPSTSSMPSCLMVPYEYTSLSETATDSEEVLDFPFTNLPQAATDVVVTVSLRGDLDGFLNFYYAEGEYLFLGYPGRYVNYTKCDASFVDEDFVVAATFFNNVADDGQFDLTLRPFRSFMDPKNCTADPQQAYIKLSYTYCELPSLTPTSTPSSIPTAQPSPEPSSTPTAKPTNSPSSSLMPTPIPTCPMLLYEYTTPTVAVTGVKEILKFPLTNLPPAATDVAMSVSLRGDLVGGLKWYYVEGNRFFIGYAARYGNYSQCNTTFVDEDFEISAASFNSVTDEGQFDLKLRPFRTFINATECAPDAHEAYITLSYMYCKPPPTIFHDSVDYYELGLCGGDCDEDYDCLHGLVCLQREDSDGTLAVPGCLGTPEIGVDYCVKAKDGELIEMADDGVPEENFPLGVCEGDCDYDSDCEGSLRCYQRSDYEPVPGCTGDGSDGSDYCYAPFEMCEGNCTDDYDCAYGLVCHHPSSSNVISDSGCTISENVTDYCVVPEDGGLVLVGDDDKPEDKFPLGNCEGECDEDSDCEEGLQCFQRSNYNQIPGCKGLGSYGSDYCYNSTAPPEEGVLVITGDNGDPVDKFPLGECQGECDDDAQCKEGLRCFQRDGYEPVPGCTGVGSYDLDYCFVPFEMCEAGCREFYSDCEPGLACAQPYSLNDTLAVSGCPDISADDTNHYCLPTLFNDTVDYFELGLCGGDCNDDDWCEFGLVCLQREVSDGTLAVPGCLGTPQIGWDYCVKPDDDQLVLMGDDGDPTGNHPLGECQGDCDHDSDCKEGLQCFQRYGLDPVPGCTGVGSSGYDYCFVPLEMCETGCREFYLDCEPGLACVQPPSSNGTLAVSGCPDISSDDTNFYCLVPEDGQLVIMGWNGDLKENYPLGECQGDCEVDSDCEEDLQCYFRDGYETVPGCTGRGYEGDNYCYNYLSSSIPSDAPSLIPSGAPSFEPVIGVDA
jgi:hypothetical protein